MSGFRVYTVEDLGVMGFGVLGCRTPRLTLTGVYVIPTCLFS